MTDHNTTDLEAVRDEARAAEGVGENVSVAINNEAHSHPAWEHLRKVGEEAADRAPGAETPYGKKMLVWMHPSKGTLNIVVDLSQGRQIIPKPNAEAITVYPPRVFKDAGMARAWLSLRANPDVQYMMVEIDDHVSTNTKDLDVVPREEEAHQWMTDAGFWFQAAEPAAGVPDVWRNEFAGIPAADVEGKTWRELADALGF